MIRPSTVGPHPTRGAAVPGAGTGPPAPIGGFILADDGIADLVQPGPFHLLQRGHVLHAELGNHPPGQLPGLLGTGRIAAAARLRRRAMDQSLRRRHPEQRRHLRASARLTVDHHAVRVAPEVRDVVPNPPKRRHQVGHADVDRIGVGWPAELGEVEKPEDIETMVDGHGDDVVMPRHLRAVLRGEFVGRAEREAAAVDVEHHRAPAGQARRPDVHLEHVLALPAVGPLLEERLLARPVMKALRTIGSVGQGRVLAVPWLGRLGRQPPVLSPGRRAIRHSLERDDAIVHVAAHLAVLRGRHGRSRRAAAPCGRLGPGRPGGLGGVSGAGQRGPHARRGGQAQHLPTIERTATLII